MNPNRFKFLHAADIHLDSPLHGLERYEGAPVDTIRNATREAFDNLVELALEEKVDFVLLAGDLYDGDWKDYNTGLFFSSRMGRLGDAGIRVFLIAGNHDAASQITRYLSLPDNVSTFSTKKAETFLLKEFNVGIHGQGFSTKAVTEDLSQGFPQGDPNLFNIGLLHTSLDGKPGHEPYAPCTVDGLRSKNYQYWALGHVHRREVIEESPWIIFPGNLQGRHARETGAKGCTLVIVEDGEVLKVKHHNLDHLRWAHSQIQIEKDSSIEELFEQIQNEIAKLIENAEGRFLALRLTLMGRCKLHSQLLAEEVKWKAEFRGIATLAGKGEVWVEKISFETSSLQDHQRPSLSNDALGELLQFIDTLEQDQEQIATLGSEITALKLKLPPDLQSGSAPFDPLGKKQIQGTLLGVRELLLQRLLERGEK